MTLERSVSPVTSDGGDGVQLLNSGAVIALIVFAPLSLMFAQIDVVISATFFSERGFAGNAAPVEFVRDGFKLVYILACVSAVTGVIVAHLRQREFAGLSATKHLFLVCCLAIGPGLVTNLALKDQWGRARPREIVQFGGDKTFTAALIPARQCRTNCSFVSGEASSMYMVFFAAALAYRRRAKALIACGLAAGLAAGAIRIAQGGHFFSDVVFAGIAMALTAVALHRLFAVVPPRFAAGTVRG